MPSDFISGAFRAPRTPEGVIEVRSPADLSDVVGHHAWSLAQVDDAVASARSAFRPWRRLTLEARAGALKAYQQQLKLHSEKLAQCIAREIGKPLWEAKAEVQAMVTKVDVTLSEGSQFAKDSLIADLPGEIRYRPHGVAAVLGPFNFPGHLPNGQIVPALLMGNTVVFKPSDKAPQTAVLIAKCFEAAGFPKGVMNIVQGSVATAEKLVAHPGIDAILFTGSAAVGQRIVAANAHRPGVLVALELGGKNASLVFDDCDLERTVRELAFSAFATAGQRCTATSRVVVTKGIAAPLSERLAAVAKSVVVGHVFDEGVFMGPLISDAARRALLEAQERAVRHGFLALVEGGAAKVSGREGFYVRPAIHVAPAKVTSLAGYTDTELFAPDLSVVVVESVEDAIAVANDTPFGLSSAVFTRDRAIFEACVDGLEVGVLHWNRSSAGASGRLPFGGIKGSGNHRPAGILMGQSCAYPLGVLMPPLQEGPLPSWPGITF